MAEFDLKGTVEEFFKDKGNWRLGFYTGMVIALAVLYLASSGEIALPLAWTSNEYEVGIGEKQFFIHRGENILASMDVENISGECMDIQLHYQNGQNYAGNFCEGQSFNLQNFLVIVDNVVVGSDLTLPINLRTYKTVNLGGFFIFLMIFLTIIGIIDKVNQINQKKSSQAYRDKRKKLAKKFKVEEDDIDDLREMFNED